MAVLYIFFFTKWSAVWQHLLPATILTIISVSASFFAFYQRPKMFTFSYLCPLFLILLIRFSFLLRVLLICLVLDIFIVKPVCDITTRVTSSLLLQYECLPPRPSTNTSPAYKRHCLVLFYVFPPVFVSILIITLPTSR
jgi:hypothetical protein